MAKDDAIRTRRNRERIEDARLMAEYAVYTGRDAASALAAIADCEKKVEDVATGDQLLGIIFDLGKLIAPTTFTEIESGQKAIRARKEATLLKVLYLILCVIFLYVTLQYTKMYFIFTNAQDEMKGISARTFIERIDDNISLFKKIAILQAETADPPKIAKDDEANRNILTHKEYIRSTYELITSYQKFTVSEGNIRNTSDSNFLLNISCANSKSWVTLNTLFCQNSYPANLPLVTNYPTTGNHTVFPEKAFQVANLEEPRFDDPVPDLPSSPPKPSTTTQIPPVGGMVFQPRPDYATLVSYCSDREFVRIECRDAYLSYIGLSAMTLGGHLDARVIGAQDSARAYAWLLGSFILPLLYGLLGASILHLRMFLDPEISDPDFWSVSVRSVLGAFAAVLLLAIGGPSIQSITTGSGAIIGSFGLAFTIGYSVEVFFGFLQKLIYAFSNEQKPTSKPAG